MTDLFGAVPGPSNSLLDVTGLRLGHATCDEGAGDSGVTVILSPGGATASVDVRGGGPGTRETDLLEPHNTVEQVHAIALCGGSAFGLAAVDGVMATLVEEGIGFPVLGPEHPEKVVPIVPAAVIFDLLLGSWESRPTASTGAAAARAALRSRGAVALGPRGTATSGNIGAGLAASAGALKGGFGQASAVLPELPGELARLSGATVAAGMVVNPQGSVFDPRTGQLWGMAAQLSEEFGPASDHAVPAAAVDAMGRLGLGGTKLPAPGSKLNTTIGVVATDAPLTKAQAKRLALAAHDGIARAIRPAHLPMDGDTIFGLSTSTHPLGAAGGADSPNTVVDPMGMSVLSATAAQCVERAIVHAVLAAEPAFGHESWASIVGL